MSAIDLTEALEAGRLARRSAYFEGRTADQCTLAAVTAAAPLIEAAVRAQVSREIEADAESIERAAEGWRTSERDPNNTTAGADFDRINAEHRESFAKNLRALAARIPGRCRMSAPVVNTTVRYAVCCCWNGKHGVPGRSPIWWPLMESAEKEASHPPYSTALHHFVERTTSERVIAP